MTRLSKRAHSWIMLCVNEFSILISIEWMIRQITHTHTHTHESKIITKSLFQFQLRKMRICSSESTWNSSIKSLWQYAVIYGSSGCTGSNRKKIAAGTRREGEKIMIHIENRHQWNEDETKIKQITTTTHDARRPTLKARMNKCSLVGGCVLDGATRRTKATSTKTRTERDRNIAYRRCTV